MLLTNKQSDFLVLGWRVVGGGSSEDCGRLGGFGVADEAGGEFEEKQIAAQGKSFGRSFTWRIELGLVFALAEPYEPTANSLEQASGPQENLAAPPFRSPTASWRGSAAGFIMELFPAGRGATASRCASRSREIDTLPGWLGEELPVDRSTYPKAEQPAPQRSRMYEYAFESRPPV
jgi:hypothetical protein